MRNVTFYLLNQNDAENALNTIEKFTCNLAANKWREGKRVIILCKDNIQAIRIDRILWNYDSNAFIPHNLVGESSFYNSPVEIWWPHNISNKTNIKKKIIINLLPTCTDFIKAFYEVIDFVPSDNILKKLARNRYKTYRSAGFKLAMAHIY